MNWAQFEDPVSHMCLPGAVVACWSLTQEMAGSSPFNVINFFVTAEFSEKHLGKTPLLVIMYGNRHSLRHGCLSSVVVGSLIIEQKKG